MFMLDNRSLPIDIGFTHNGIQYPNNWLRLASSSERSAIGITEVADPEPYDDRFYWGLDNPKDLEGLKAYWVSQIKDTAGKLLAQTDWMIVRKMERSIDIPAAIATSRASVVSECARLETAIADAADVLILITAVGSQNWGEESVF
jgi:pyruvate/oxaloacetate carboxyltransferase